MDLNKILKAMEKKTDKSWTYLKGLFNSANSEYNEQFGDSLTDERKMIMALTKVGKKYDLTREDVESLIGDDTPALEYAEEASAEDLELAADIEEMFEEEETLTVGNAIDFVKSNLKITDDPNHGVDPKTGKVDVSSGSPSAWKRFLSAIPDPIKPKTAYTKTPSLIVEIGATYYLKMTNLDDVPEGREFEGKYGTYTMYPFKVKLMKVSDEDLYDVKYKSGDFEGELAFVNGQTYTLWLNEKSIGFYKLFWESLTEDGRPDERLFTYKFTKKGKYNVYTYKIPKKR